MNDVDFCYKNTLLLSMYCTQYRLWLTDWTLYHALQHVQCCMPKYERQPVVHLAIAIIAEACRIAQFIISKQMSVKKYCVNTFPSTPCTMADIYTGIICNKIILLLTEQLIQCCRHKVFDGKQWQRFLTVISYHKTYNWIRQTDVYRVQGPTMVSYHSYYDYLVNNVVMVVMVIIINLW